MSGASAVPSRSRPTPTFCATSSTLATSDPAKPRPCPICRKAATAKYAPFCSLRCANVDLGRWFGGHYAIPAEEAPDDQGDGLEDFDGNGEEPR
ncbi:MAG: DNA gyrase inhibitor YacG [Alphaproteobacteria bacterium]|nr:DNA gyrase inhibitor YacG [Alphaproteobacteria bacterium]